MSDDRRLHAALIGKPGSRSELNTPALVLDLDALDRNIAAMAHLAEQSGTALRPHAKTHKSVDIARRQVAAGAIGICCAKLGEAEALAEGGIDGLHLTSPVVTPPARVRLVALAERSPRLSVVVDNADNLAALAADLQRAGTRLGVLVDIDPGIHRTGVRAPDDAVALAQAAEAHPNLVYRGVQYYCGVQQHIEDFSERRQAIADRTAYLDGFLAALAKAGLDPEIVTGSGTGTHRIDLEMGTFTELQVGSYVFMDRQYADCDLTGSGTPAFEPSLFIDTSVISANGHEIATLDAGFKAMATDAGPPRFYSGAPKGAKFAFMGDEHGAVVNRDSDLGLTIGNRLVLTVPHCDPTVNLYDSYHVVRGDTLVDIWPVSARGRSR